MSGKQEPRRLPAPWSVEEIAAAYLVTDAMGRRVARAIARLPEILSKG